MIMLRKIYYDMFGGGGGFDMPTMPQQMQGYEPMSFEQHSLLLDKEAELATARDESQRQFLLEQEEMRMQQEESQRVALQQQEAQQEREIREQEQEGASGVVAGTVDEIEADVDDVVANMYEALLGGVGAGDEDDGSEPLPE